MSSGTGTAGSGTLAPFFLLVGAGGLAIGFWLGLTAGGEVTLRAPGRAPRPAPPPAAANPNPGTLVPGEGVPGERPGAWPQFRGTDRMNRAPAINLERLGRPGGLEPLWRVRVCEGYAGPVVAAGRVFLHDHDREKSEDQVRCLSLADGREIWRYTYHVKIKMNHGITRTTPAVRGDRLVTLGPKCHLLCLRADTGEPVWRRDLVREHETRVPPWYAGQCPLIDGEVAVIAPGGKPAFMGVELATGRTRWETPNPGGWGMTHSSVVKVEMAGEAQYVYCHTKGVAGVSAKDGRVLWNHPGWKINIANVPTPLPIPGDRIFLCGGYNAGACMLHLLRRGEKIEVEEIFRVGPKVFGSDQQTPVLYGDHIYGVIPGGRMACLDLAGKQRWVREPVPDFGLGFYMLAGGILLAAEGKTGLLRLIEPSPRGYRERAALQAVEGHEIWAPFAVAGGRFLLRNMTELLCLEAD